MRTVRVLPIVSFIALGVLFAAASWFRVSSLGAIPWHNGDESYEGMRSSAC